uniref:AAA+ ATPase domain-containing protein n=1 Tax=Corethron hystrix TaxID=216773 RepID=A0A7S1B434_9STRA|mmetsp:Transcript_12021/g.26293  ORF Transcript_12021/g.26293 Transcript_12021/m.26293 type:complete len:968 (+) Transcript_12021:104-3007(+)
MTTAMMQSLPPPPKVCEVDMTDIDDFYENYPPDDDEFDYDPDGDDSSGKQNTDTTAGAATVSHSPYFTVGSEQAAVNINEKDDFVSAIRNRTAELTTTTSTAEKVQECDDGLRRHLSDPRNSSSRVRPSPPSSPPSSRRRCLLYSSLLIPPPSFAYCTPPGTQWIVDAGSAFSDGSCAMTLRSGRQCYIAPRRRNRNDDRASASFSGLTSVLEVSVSVLLSRLRKKERMISLANATDDDETSLGSPTSSSSQLWTTRYAPTAISHLLTDFRPVRHLLRGLRQWDGFCLRSVPPTPPPGWSQDFLDNNNPSASFDVVNPMARPPSHRRAVLLSGPPGAGKTSLATVAARHAGYDPIEINASEDRCEKTFAEKLTGLMEDGISFSERGKRRRPNCIILDEVDGESRQCVDAILKILTAEPPTTGSRSGHTGRQRRQQPHARRPTILICNDRYAPALRPLLPYCYHIVVRPPDGQRIRDRLKHILRVEIGKSPTDGQVLNKMVTRSGNDIRSCLHTLQFAGGGGKGDMGAILRRMTEDRGGGKDRSSTSPGVQLLRSTFSRGRASLRPSRVRGFLEEAWEACGENLDEVSRSLDLLHLNLHGAAGEGAVDPSMEKRAAACDWLSDAAWATNRGGNGCDIARVTACAVGCLLRSDRLSTASEAQWIYSTRPLAEVRYRHSQREGILRSFQTGRPGWSSCWDKRSTVTEVVPYALWALASGKRGGGRKTLNRPATSLALLNNDERAAMADHVNRMQGLGLQYVRAELEQEDSGGWNNNFGDNKREMRLEPEIEMLVAFKELDDVKKMNRDDIPFVLKELIVQSLKVEKMRQQENVESGILLSKNNTNIKGKKSVQFAPTPSKNKEDAKSFQETSMQRNENANSVQVKKAPQPSSSKQRKGANSSLSAFLSRGRPKGKESIDENDSRAKESARKKIKHSHTGTGLLLSDVIWYKYQKGFSQAVKVPCKMEDLL